MTGDQLLDAVGEIREDFIREAAPPAAAARRRPFLWGGAAAACLAVVLAGSMLFVDRAGSGTDSASNATASESTGAAGGGSALEETAEDSAAAGEAEGGVPVGEVPGALTVEGTRYVLAEPEGPWPETCPAGFARAGEVVLPETGERCPYYTSPDQPGVIWVRMSCYDWAEESLYQGYVRYDAQT